MEQNMTGLTCAAGRRFCACVSMRARFACRLGSVQPCQNTRALLMAFVCMGAFAAVLLSAGVARAQDLRVHQMQMHVVAPIAHERHMQLATPSYPGGLIHPTSPHVAYAPTTLPALTAPTDIDVLAHNLWHSQGCGVEPCRPAPAQAPTAMDVIQRIGSLHWLSATLIHEHKEVLLATSSGSPIVRMSGSLMLAPTFGGGNGYGLRAVGTF